MKAVRTLVALSFVLVLAPAHSALADVIIVVPGTADPWLAGMPDGSTASFGDVAPAQSPVSVTGIGLTGGLWFSSVGTTDHCPAGGCVFAPAEGDFAEGVASHAGGAQNGISDIFAPIDSLLGVFLGPGAPNGFAAPPALDFSTAGSRDFDVLNPLLQQVFYIGNGFRNDGLTPQAFFAPAGATRLYLGTMDGYGWFNNSGSLEVTVRSATVPEPTSLALLSVALGLMSVRARRRRAEHGGPQTNRK